MPTTTLRRPRVVLFGDSLTERSFDSDGGWGAGLAHHFQRKVDIINRGFGGYNTECAVLVAPHVFPPGQMKDVELVTIWWGANDCITPANGNEDKHVPLERFRQNLEEVHAIIKASGAKRTVFITPPPMDHEGRVRHQQQKANDFVNVPEPDRTLENSGVYARACRELAQKLGSPVVDLWTVLQDIPNWGRDLLVDGLHFTPAGQRAVFAAVLPVLEAAFPEFRVEDMPHYFPWWGDLDFNDLKGTIQRLAEADAAKAHERGAMAS